MAIKGSTFTSDAAIAVTPGNTDVIWQPDGVVIPNGLHLVDLEAGFNTRAQLTMKNRVPVLDLKTGKYTKVKKGFSLATPTIDDEGMVQFSTIRVEFDYPPLLGFPSTLATLVVQMLVGPEAADFRRDGVLA